MMPAAAHPPRPLSRAVFQTETPVHALVSQLRSVMEMAGPAEKREVYRGEPEGPAGWGAAAVSSSCKKMDFVPK